MASSAHAGRAGALPIRKRLKRDAFLYALVLPGMLFFLVFCYLPMYGVTIAFRDYYPFMGTRGVFTSPWVGLEHFKSFVTSYYFVRVMRNTLVISALKLFFGFPAPILLAILLNELRGVGFKKVTQTISYLPHFLSWVIVAGLIVQILSVSSGPVNALLRNMGRQPVNFLGTPVYFRPILVLSSIWKEIGWGSIIYLAAITGIDPQLYEAAVCDGASRLQRAVDITLPGISHIVSIMLIFAVGGLLSAGFEQILLLYNPSVYEVGDIIDTYVYRKGLIDGEFAFSTAVGLFRSVIALILIVGANTVARRMDQEGVW